MPRENKPESAKPFVFDWVEFVGALFPTGTLAAAPSCESPKISPDPALRLTAALSAVVVGNGSQPLIPLRMPAAKCWES